MATKTWTNCRVCGGEELRSILNLGEQPLSGVFPRPDEKDPSTSPLDLVRCASPVCGLLQLRHTAELSEMYGATYGYYSSISPMMVEHLEKKTESLIRFARLQSGDVVMDIGCNDGTLLNSYGADRGFVRIGMDPSAAKFCDHYDPDIRVTYDFFSANQTRQLIGDKKCKVITSIAMFYDLDDPVSFVRDIAEVLDHDGVWAAELSYLPLLLKQLTYDQICHEHVTYLGLRDMDAILRRCGLRLLDVWFNDMNGGSFYFYAGKDAGPHKPNTAKLEGLLAEEAILGTEAPYERLRHRVLNHRDEVRYFFDSAKAAGKSVYGYGASTKGNVVMNYCGIGPADLVVIGDRNPEKDGRVTPGTRIPIVTHADLRARRPDYIFSFIWHLRKEVITDELDYLRAGGKLVFALPRLHVVDSSNCERYLQRSFEDLAFAI
jgi:NDP-4-keto-2,6-dideoxyhexose 3-C-methyltransferase